MLPEYITSFDGDVSSRITASRAKPISMKDVEEKPKDNGNGQQPRTWASRFSFVGAATSLVAAVREDVEDIVSTVRDTDWTKEFSNFGRAVQEETTEAMRSIEGLPEKAGHVLPGMTSVSQRVGTGLHLLARGTKDFFDQAVGTIEAELGMQRDSSRMEIERSLSGPSRRFSRFEADVTAMQRSSSTYCEEPDDAADFEQWKAGFSLEDRENDILKLIAENAFMAELHRRIVPMVVEREVFWTRYFYRLHKLQEMHNQRQQLAERTLRLHEEEEEQLQWDDEPAETQPSPQVEKESEVEPKPRIEDTGGISSKSGSVEKADSDWSVVDAVPNEKPAEASQKVSQKTEEKRSDKGEDADIDEDWGEWD